MSTAHRFLGFGFAAADLLLELGADGRVTFALGAGEAVMGQSDMSLAGKSWISLFDVADHAMVQALFDGLEGVARAGPVVVAVAGKPDAAQRYASLTAIRLPQNGGAISCVMSRAAPRGAAGLQTRESFEARAGELLAGASQELELAFVELAGLSRPDRDQAKTDAMLAGVLRAEAYRGEAPAQVAPDRFALIRGRDQPTESMEGRITKALKRSGVDDVTPATAAMPMTGADSPRQVTQALRFAINQVTRDGLAGGLPANFSAALDEALQTTLSSASELSTAIRERRFTLAFQPVVSLADGRLHHHEVLVRFGNDNSPFPTIRLAEEMELIEALDEAVLEETLAVLTRTPGLVLAVNLSGRSLMSDAYVEHAVKLIKRAPGIFGRLMFELTESAAVEDLSAADRRLQTLRRAGCEVCLDDFGAGAASLAYLQQLTLDVLKIDGRYIRDLQHGGREATFVRHLVNMCGELEVKTLAEMVETPEAEDAVRRAGVDFAQGWHYGRPAETPIREDALPGRNGAPRGGLGREGPLSVKVAQDRKKEQWG